MSFCSIEMQGLFGWFLNYVRGIDMKTRMGTKTPSSAGNVFDFSLISLGRQISIMTTGIAPFQTLFLQSTFFLLVIAVPLMFLGAVIAICIWASFADTTDIHPIQLQRLQTVVHTLFAWSAVDVCVLGAILTIIEMGSSSFMPATKGLRDWIRVYLRPVLQIPGENNEIVALSSSIHMGAVLTLIGAMLLLSVGFLFIRSAGWLLQGSKALKDVDEDESEPEQVDIDLDEREDTDENDSEESSSNVRA